MRHGLKDSVGGESSCRAAHEKEITKPFILLFQDFGRGDRIAR